MPGGEAIFAAGDRTQAGIGFREAANIIREDRRLVGATTIYDAHNSAKKIVLDRDGTFLEIVSSDGNRQHGRTPSFVLADELHIWQGYELWKALRSGLPKTRNSLLIVATTAGRGKENIAFDIVDRARKIARGDLDDPSLLPVLFEADPNADWQDEDLWYRLNPGLALGYQDIEGLREVAREAEASFVARDTFRQYHLNQWLDHSESPFVEMALYDEGARPIDHNALAGAPCWIAVDMSVVDDLTAVVAAFRDPSDPEAFIVVPHIFCPKDVMREKEKADRVPYPAWADEGFITPIDAPTIEPKVIEDVIRDLMERHDVREVVFDRAYAREVYTPLMRDYPDKVFNMDLSPAAQSSGLQVLERAIREKRFTHSGHKVLRWNFANVSIRQGNTGMRTMVKPKRGHRIDGAFATWMAVSRAAANEVTRSIYASDAWSDDWGAW